MHDLILDSQLCLCKTGVLMAHCMNCPRRCGADRETHTGLCNAGKLPRVARVALHHWEEPCISGTRGSGAVFFAGCNLNCVFCQNYALHDGTLGTPQTADMLAAHYLDLQAQGAHNINLVTPTPHLDVIRQSLLTAKSMGLRIPVVYNTNAYELTDSLRQLEGLIDIYLPDLKYVTPALAERFSGFADYFTFASDAIREMYRQVGTLSLDADGIAQRGLLVRHLVLPACVDEARRVLDAIRSWLPSDTHLSLMRQYAPTPNITEPPLNRRLTDREYDRIVDYCIALGFENVWCQEKESATLDYTPQFTKTL